MTGALLLVAMVVLLCQVRSVRARSELLARVEHELRGAAAGLFLSAERMRRDVRGRGYALELDVQLDRLSVALDDLRAAREGRRAPGRRSEVRLERLASQALAGARPLAAAAGRDVRLEWRVGRDRRVGGDPRRLSQVLANLTANAVSHGAGDVTLRALETEGGVRVEVRDEGGPARSVPVAAGSGRGLRIAADAAADLGGRISLHRTEEGTVAAVDLPAAER